MSQNNRMRYRSVLILSAACLSLACTTETFSQLRVFVDEDSTATTPTGTLWSTAYRHLSEGIADALSQSNGGAVPVQVWVAEGTYRPDENEANPTGTNPSSGSATARAKSFQMHNNVGLYGGFAGNESGDLAGFNKRQPLQRLTILSGDLDEDGLDTDNSDHVVTALSPSSTVGLNNTAIIDGFVVTMGFANGVAPPPYAGVTNNPQDIPNGSGGGLLVIGIPGIGQPEASPTVVRCTFKENSADYGGGTFHHGTQHSGRSYVNCVWRDNEATEEGGGFANFGLAQAAEPPLACVTNTGLRFINCLFVGNDAPLGGGYISGWTASAALMNCTFVHNSSGVFARPTGLCPGGVSVKNSIVYLNGDESLADQIDGCVDTRKSCVQSLTGSLSGCLTFDGTGTDQSTAADPLFVDEDEPGGDYRLTQNSPCIDKASLTDPDLEGDDHDVNQNNLFAADELTPDLELRTRPWTDPVHSTGDLCRLDMGAYEFEAPLWFCLGDVNQNGVVNIDDLLDIINSWGACTGCQADIHPGHCAGGNGVDIDDLLLVINGCGCTTPIYTGVAESSMPQSVDDCMDACSVDHETFSQAWNDCVSKCVDALCAAEIINCDE